MHINSGLSDTANYNSVRNYNLDAFFQEFKDILNIIMLGDDTSYDELIHDTIKGLSSHESVSFYDCTSILNQYKGWFNTFKNVQPFYAMKCNPANGLMNLISKLPNACFDCASSQEIQACLDRNIPPENIIYANPVKSKENVLYMAEKGVWCGTLDCVEEVDKLYEILGDRCTNCKIVLRLYVDDGHSVIKLGSKYGCRKEEVPSILERCKKYNMQVVGVAFHIGSGSSDPNDYDSAIQDAKEVFDLGKQYGFSMNLLDLGGGWSGDLADNNLNNPKLEEAHAIIARSLERNGFNQIEDLKIISEPGRYFNDHTISVACTIINVQKRGNTFVYRINEGVMGIFHDIILTNEMGFEVVPLGNNSKETRPSCIIGPSNLDEDVIVKSMELPEMKVGDVLLFKKVGAYTLSLTSVSLRQNQKYYYVIRNSSISCL